MNTCLSESGMVVVVSSSGSGSDIVGEGEREGIVGFGSGSTDDMLTFPS